MFHHRAEPHDPNTELCEAITALVLPDIIESGNINLGRLPCYFNPPEREYIRFRSGPELPVLWHFNCSTLTEAQLREHKRPAIVAAISTCDAWTAYLSVYYLAQDGSTRKALDVTHTNRCC